MSGDLVLLDHSLYSLHSLSLRSVRSLWPFGDLILSGTASVDFSFLLFKDPVHVLFQFCCSVQVSRSSLKDTPSVL